MERKILTHLDLVFLGNIGPVLGGNTGLPIELDSQRCLWLVIGRPEASHIVPRLSSGERKLTRFHLLRAVVAVPIRRSDLGFQDAEHDSDSGKNLYRFRGRRKGVLGSGNK